MPGEPEIFESFCLLEPWNQRSLLQVLKKKKCPSTTEDLTVGLTCFQSVVTRNMVASMSGILSSGWETRFPVEHKTKLSGSSVLSVVFSLIICLNQKCSCACIPLYIEENAKTAKTVLHRVFQKTWPMAMTHTPTVHSFTIYNIPLSTIFLLSFCKVRLPAQVVTRCQIWGTIELHRDPILKVLLEC